MQKQSVSFIWYLDYHNDGTLTRLVHAGRAITLGSVLTVDIVYYVLVFGFEVFQAYMHIQ